MKRSRRIAIVFTLAAGLAAAFAACKPGVGDHCQVTEDCADGLTCSQATQTCSDTNGTMPTDAEVPDAPLVDAPIDAPRPIDAPPAPDAAVDAMVDAMVDAS